MNPLQIDQARRVRRAMARIFSWMELSHPHDKAPKSAIRIALEELLDEIAQSPISRKQVAASREDLEDTLALMECPQRIIWRLGAEMRWMENDIGDVEEVDG